MSANGRGQQILSQYQYPFLFILQVLGYIVNGSRMPSSSSHLQHNTLSTGIVAAIVIATIAGICFVLLVVLQVVVKLYAAF